MKKDSKVSADLKGKIEKLKTSLRPEWIAEAENLSDACAFRNLIPHYESPETEIEFIIIVDTDYISIAETAAFFVHYESSRENEFLHLELMLAGVFRYVYPSARRSPDNLLVSYSYDEIGLMRKIHVIQTLPFYLVELTGEIWN